MTGDQAAGAVEREELDPRQALSIIDQQRRRAALTEPSTALVTGAWGAAWLVGYTAMWLSAGDDGAPALWAGALALGLGVVAVVTTIVHSARRSHGIRGVSAVEGALYGFAWPVGFAAQGLIVGGISGAGAPPRAVAVAANSIAALVVALLYIAGGALWREPLLYGLGVWMALVAGLAALAGVPLTYLVMGLAGGGVALVASLVVGVRARRAHRARLAGAPA
jgi:hypothetical protein